MKRYTELPFPPYKFVPGHGQHPEKVGGYLHGHEIESHPLTSENFHSHEIYLFAVDLFNEGHYWASHVYWEVLWNLAGRKGEVADFLKGLIKLAAAGVKFQLNQAPLAIDHLARAEELFQPLTQPYLGIDSLKYLHQIQKDSIDYNLEFQFSIPLEVNHD